MIFPRPNSTAAAQSATIASSPSGKLEPYWLCARLGNECRAKAEKGEIQRLLRQLQAIRVGTLEIATQDRKRLLTQIPPELNALLARVGLVYSPNRQPGLRCSLKRQARLRALRESLFKTGGS